ncbi:TetR/AcrR family transcriptional regulator [Spelaeicoccus albus]|uniref:TetR/AcrR family transcriptional regulator n=1 Tax=Spelaeicoccus albus TaxID=1280376 RepID=UPI001C53A053|nr:hypothetical protein [Spelaeicoccus albus]
MLHGISNHRDGISTDDSPDAALRAGLVSSMLVGMIMSRQVIAVPMLATADTEKLVQMVAPGIQAILIGPTLSHY